MSEPLDLVLSRLPGVREVNGGWKALCPAHDDTNPSLSISLGDDGRVLLCCHADCETAAIVEKMGLNMSDLFPGDGKSKSAKKQPLSPIIAEYFYHDAEGHGLFRVTRHEPMPDEDKPFRQWRPDGRGGWKPGVRGYVEYVPYRLPQLLDAVKRGVPIFIPEGEKDVHTCEKIGLVATTNPGGANSKWRAEWSDYFTGGNIIILPDNDDSGRKHAEDVASKLSGAASSIRIVNLPGLPPKGDVTDFIQAERTLKELLALVDAAEEWTPPPKTAEPEPVTRDFPFTDLGNSERLIAAHGENLRFDVDAERWLVWNGKRWEYDGTGKVDRLAMKVVRGMNSLLKDLNGNARDELYRHIKKSESAPRLVAMISLAEKLDGVPVQAADLDIDPMLMNCLNGTIDLRTGELKPHARGDMLTKLAPVEYDPAAKASRWRQFLEEVFQGDAEIIAFVKRMAGYCLTGSTQEQCVFMLTGKGANGKSTFVEAVRRVLGDYAGDTPFFTFLTDKNNQNTSDLAGLMGKRLVTASEGEEGQTFNESLLKTCTGSEPVTCRHLYREYFSYVPTYKIVFSTNEVPRIRSQNYAMKRRLKLIPFRQRFYDPQDGKQPVKDDRLLEKLLAEKNGILAWAVEGCLEWGKTGLDTPTAIRAAIDKLFESQDPLAEFLDTECVIRPAAEVVVDVLWQRYLLWCEQTGRTPAYKQPHFFTRSLYQRDGIEPKKGTGGVRMSTGIGLADGGNDGSSEPDSGASGAQSDFSENLPMKEFHDKVSANTDLAPLSATSEREIEVSDTPSNSDPATKNDPFFDSEEAFDSLAELTPPEEDTADAEPDPTGPIYVCGKCKAQVTLMDYKPGVYSYTCAACSHTGVLPHYDYQLWLRNNEKATKWCGV